MGVLKVLFCFLFCGWVLSEEGLLPEPCDVQDKVCLGRATETFLDKTAAGISEFDIRPIDPIVIPSVDYESEELGLTIHLKNLNVTGLRKQKIYDFKMDVATREAVLTTKVDLQIRGDLTVERSRAPKTVSGTYVAIGTALGTSSYNYTLKTDDKGVEHFDVGPETITCDVSGVVDTTLSSEFESAGAASKEFWQKYVSHKPEVDKKAFCEIVKVLYRTVIHNLRVAAKILPKNAFFNNI